MPITPKRLLTWRRKHARRRLARLRAALDRLSLTVLPRSALGKAITYTLKNWIALSRYTDAPFLSIDNNHSERQIKPLVIGRKNRLFAGSDAGASNAAILFSLIVSCKLADVDPFAYLHDILIRQNVPLAALAATKGIVCRFPEQRCRSQEPTGIRLFFG